MLPGYEKQPLPIADSAQEEIPPELKAIAEKIAAGQRLTVGDMRNLMPAKLQGDKLTVTLDSDGGEAVMHELNGQESMIADRMVADSTSTDLKYKAYALMALDSLRYGTQDVILPPPTDDMKVGQRARAFKHARHLKALAEAYALFFETPMDAGELKNA